MAQIKLEINNLSKRYKNSDTDSLQNLNLEIKEQQKFGILGPNGAGKTTLISIICGVIESSAGHVSYFVDNKEIDLKQFRNFMGYVPQEYAFFEKLTPLQNLEYFGALYNLTAQEIKSQSVILLKKLGLLKVASKRVETFSGGMKRRLNLALGIIHNPSILFLDEPTVGIDVHSKNAIINFLDSLNTKGTTIIYTSHDLAEVESFCSQILLLDNGKIIANNSTEKLLIENEESNLKSVFIKLTGNQYRD